MKSIYYQFVNFIHDMNSLVFATMWLMLVACILVLIMKFFKKYNGEQKKFEKVSSIVLALILFALVAYLTYLR